MTIKSTDSAVVTKDSLLIKNNGKRGIRTLDTLTGMLP